MSGLKDEKLIKKANLHENWNMKTHFRVLRIFRPNIVKIDPYSFELYRFKIKVGAFWDTVYTCISKLKNLLDTHICVIDKTVSHCHTSAKAYYAYEHVRDDPILHKTYDNTYRTNSFIHSFYFYFTEHWRLVTNKTTRKVHVLKVFHRTKRPVALTTAHRLQMHTHKVKHKSFQQSATNCQFRIIVII